MDGNQFDHIVRRLGAVVSRRRVTPHVSGALAGVVLAMHGPGKSSESLARKRKKKTTLCLNGQTVQASKKKKKKLLKSGATPGECPTCTPDCTGKCGGAADGCGGTCTSCGAGALCDGGTCRACTVTCDGDGIRCGLDLQTALNQGGTVVACPGRYVGNFNLGANVTLIGAGDGDDPAAHTMLDAMQQGRVVSLRNGITATLQSVRIMRGNDPTLGGGIFSLGGLTLKSSTVSQSAAPAGGGIYHESPLGLQLLDCVILENQASNNGGGLRIEVGPVTITNTAIRGNRAPTCSGFACGEGGVTLDRASSITGNTCTAAGCFGAICVGGLGTVTLNGATVSGNTTPQCQGVVC